MTGQGTDIFLCSWRGIGTSIFGYDVTCSMAPQTLCGKNAKIIRSEIAYDESSRDAHKGVGEECCGCMLTSDELLPIISLNCSYFGNITFAFTAFVLPPPSAAAAADSRAWPR